MKLISWNVNGIRSVLNKGFADFVKTESPDILCIQETKANPDQVDKLLIDYPNHYWNTAVKKGYSGTAVFSKYKPLNVSYGLNLPHHDNEGRTVCLEFPHYYLVNSYFPNSQRGLARLSYRQNWDKDFLVFIKKLEEKKPVILCGDLNVAHTDKDLANPKSNYNKNPGFTQAEIDGFNNLLNSGFIDTFRMFNQDNGHYTWWSYMFNARVKNIGWRIDYFCASNVLKDKIKESVILKEVKGSDHCPVRLILK